MTTVFPLKSTVASRPSSAEAWQLQADVDALLDRVQAWSNGAPNWPTAAACQALIARLRQRTDALRTRVEAPLVVALLGGTGTGKSSLVNALVGRDVAAAGRQRPTTLKPLVVCRPDLQLADLGLREEWVERVSADHPLLQHVVLVDCPDPDTTENDQQRDTNLARLRGILPHCDVLLVTATQQKYRSARVLDELATAAQGARLVFVQTHADQEDDIRDDWRSVLGEHYEMGSVFLVDSVAALEAQREGLPPQADFARLVELLTQRLSGSAGNRIRWANFLDLVEQALSTCRTRLAAELPAADKLRTAIDEQRQLLWERLASELREELLESRRSWDLRLLTEITSRWGMSPFAMAIRTSLGLGNLLSGGLLLKVRTPAQLALWGTWEGVRRLQRHRQEQHADQAAAEALSSGWDEAELRAASIVVAGYAREAGLGPPALDELAAEARGAGIEFVARASTQLQEVVRRAAGHRLIVASRLVYEVLWSLLLLMLLARWGKNFFYDSWLADPPREILGLNFFLGAGVCLVLWGGILIALFTWQARRGLLAELSVMFSRWTSAGTSGKVFARLDRDATQIHEFAADAARLEASLATLRREVSLPESELGRPRSPNP